MDRISKLMARVAGSMVMVVSMVVAQVNTALFTGVNVDIDAVTAPGSGQPTILFSGAIGQGGYWNPVRIPFNSSVVSVTLRNPANSADVLQMQISKPLATLVGGSAGPSPGDVGLLINDFLDIGQASIGTTTVSLFDLPTGVYDLAVYAVDPASANERTAVRVRSDIGDYGTVQIAGPVPADGSLVDQVTHRRLRFAMLRPETLRIDLEGGTMDGMPRLGTFNGLQIKKLTPTRLYVRPFNAGEGTGLDWANAIGNLRGALEIARVTPSVTEIWIAAGTYRANQFLTLSANRNEAFVIPGNLSIYGGFAGTETNINQRPGNLVTKLSGVNQQYHTVVIDGQSNILLDGLTIADGFNDLSFVDLAEFSGGAGLFVQSGANNITVRRCVFTNNRAPQGISGAIGLTGSSSVLFEDCQIHGNQSLFSAAIEAGNGCSLTMRRCAITNNVGGGGSGGVLGGFTSSAVTLENCLIANNTVELNLIDTSTANGPVTLRHCTIANNRNPVSNNVGLALGDEPTVVNCLIDGNIGPAALGAPTMDQIFSGTISGQIFDNSIQGYDDRFGTEVTSGNNNAEARFVNAIAAGAPGGIGLINVANYELASRSPARDSGFNFHAGTLMTDLKGSPRLVDDPYMINRGFSGSWVDRGCLEAQTPSEICPGDVGGQGASVGADGARDNNDFVVFIDWFFNLDPRADVGSQGAGLGPDGVLDNNDFVVFIQFFFEPCP